MTEDDRHEQFLDEFLAGDVYDIDGNPITLRQWAEIRERDPEAVRIARTEIGEIVVSTVHLGIDHSYGMGPPLIFETLIFGGGLDEEMWRYATREEAERGHERAVELVRLEIEVSS